MARLGVSITLLTLVMALSLHHANAQVATLQDFINLYVFNINGASLGPGEYIIPDTDKTLPAGKISLGPIDYTVYTGVSTNHNATHLHINFQGVLIYGTYVINGTGGVYGESRGLASGNFTIPYTFDATAGYITIWNPVLKYYDQTTMLVHGGQVWTPYDKSFTEFTQSYTFGGFTAIANQVLQDTIIQFEPPKSNAETA